MTRLLGLLAALWAGAAAAAPGPSPEPPRAGPPVVLVATIDDAITPVTAKFVEEAIAAAEARSAAALLVELDTPGGLVTSMRAIVKGILAAKIPVIVYVAPGGARAGSAGAFITIAAHVAAMAPGTNIGAASPVAVGGAEIDETMKAKVVNDAAAYIESLARQRGRNAEWAVRAVRESASITGEEAARLGVVDLLAPSRDRLLEQAHGRAVQLATGPTTLRTRDATAVPFEMRWNLAILAVLANPTLAYLLFLAGLAGIGIEFYNPGAILPGVAGVIALILAMLAFQALPLNWAGLLLLAVGVALLVAEVKVTSGILGTAGVVALALGSMILFDRSAPEYLRLSLVVIVPTVAVVAGLLLVVVGAAVRAQARPAMGGHEGLVGEVGEARTPLAPEGRVFVHGEIWTARSRVPVEAGAAVRVTAVDGLVLAVEPIDRG